MTDKEAIQALRSALASLLRQTADPDPTHPAYQFARDSAAQVFRDTLSLDPRSTDDGKESNDA